ncbi:aldehyde dehydrogenase family protein [Mycobacterium sp. NAZ190054]|uniref:aldehyde dehydrogenase family protein n=1 Tax=Mycobacterium sp. NAZ190054 TaxID=1747766 RepID=UPI0009EAC8BF|nr:aldehyde dehydrogenase family protein [Mycobacterium sp. NAZ190054]
MTIGEVPTTSDDTPRGSSADEIAAVIQIQRKAFLRDGPPSLAQRRHRMDRLAALTFDNAPQLAEAINIDFGNRPVQTTMFTEVLASISDTEYIRKHLGSWMRPRRVNGIARPLGLRYAVHYQPLGVVGVMGAWNFPLTLLIQPTMEALAAGNRVVLKAPEGAPQTSALIKNLAPQYFEPDELVVFTGGPSTAAAFASSDLDHLFFTGSAAVGRLVQRAAADHLVPVTLELGGKNPAVVAPDADIRRAAQRIANARLINSGQVCLCPDYALVPRQSLDVFVDAVQSEYRRLFPTVLDNPAFCNIIDDKHFHRIVGLVEDARRKGAVVVEAAPPGEPLPCAQQRRIAPTVLYNVTDEMLVMHEEVFGPVLCVRSYEQTDEVIDYLNDRPSPLAAYWYGPNSAEFRRFCQRTFSGGVSRNDMGLHASVNGAPFGGVGESGMGSYHGKAGFETFSHRRTIAQSRLPWSVTSLMNPPVPPWLNKAMSIALKLQRARLARRIKGFRP